MRRTRTEQGYTNAWLRASRAFLEQHPLCRICEQQGRLTPATQTDHIEPHRGDSALFWNPGNWQPLCHTCHSTKTNDEQSGRVRGCDAHGNPRAGWPSQ